MARTVSEIAQAASLLDYTPPNVEWQAPLVQQAKDPWVNYVQTSKSVTPTSPNFGTNDLIRDYNIRLSYGEDDPRGLTYDESGRPESMSDYGKRHWDEFGSAEGRTRGYTPGTLWTDPNRSYYMGYSGYGPGGGVTGDTGNGDTAEGYSNVRQIYAYGRPMNNPTGEFRYAPTGLDVGPQEVGVTNPRFTTKTSLYPHFSYELGDPFQKIGDSNFITIGQRSVPTSSINYDEDWFWI